MNRKRYNRLMRRGAPKQHPPEWRAFLELCEDHMKKQGIEHPVVVELGSYKNDQKKFYEQLLNAEHIGIDISDSGKPDIKGSTYKSKTLKALKKKLNGRDINILFIDASHRYKNVKKDYEIYAPLCKNIVALHDVELGRYQVERTREVWKFWDELKLKAHKETQSYAFCPVSAHSCPAKTRRVPKEEYTAYKDYLFISIHQHRTEGDGSQKGIGLIIKE